MYFFDLLDYYTDKVIGNQYEQIPICDVTWSDMATTSRATSDAYFKALNEWYECGTTCLEDGECKDAILAKWVQVMDDRDAYINARTDFWEMMGEECSTDGVFNKTIYDDYITAQQTLLCDIEELMFLVDDGGSGVNPTPNPCPNCVENDITISEQVWSKCNTNVSTYRDGTEIPKVTGTTQWSGLTTGAWCHYNNDPSNDAIYGKLYNWYAVVGIYDGVSLTNPSLRKQFAPSGYHVPTDDEWTVLTDYLGGINLAGGKMKEIGLCYWVNPNTGASDDYGFKALPNGQRAWSGPFGDIGAHSQWWSSTVNPLNTNGVWFRQLNYNNVNVTRGTANKTYGFAVRFIKD
jgi:uncharacterized protein (TIGR02145 family)